MKPYGLVAAGSDHLDDVDTQFLCASENSFASAMFTARKVFSSSFVISAASGDETLCMVLAV